MTSVLVGIVAVLLIAAMLMDAYEVVVLPRRVRRKLRLSRFVIMTTWLGYASLFRHMRRGTRRETLLGYYGPSIAIILLATWAVGLVMGFGMLQWALGSHLADATGAKTGLLTDLYMSGTTFFTLGLGDVIPKTPAARLLVVLEAGLGFAFLAMVISYLPVLYQSFSKRETRISLLDAWAGTPPSAGELLRRLGPDGHGSLLGPLLQEWELWAAELLESHISYPVLMYFRSQHDNQSWLSALTAILDACALTISCVDHGPKQIAQLTFAMARHAVVDLSQVVNMPPHPPEHDRLPALDQARLISLLREAGIVVHGDQPALDRLAQMRAMYEPYVNSLALRFLFDLPPWMAAPGAKDNWLKSAWR